MPWKDKNSDVIWEGETHELVGRTYTGKTRTSESMPLVWVDEAPKKKTASSSKPKRPKKKPTPKPKGATAWD
jgi:hypothetical protein